MKCKLLARQKPQMRIKVEPPRTLRSVGNLVVHTALCGASGLNSDVPLPPCQEVRNGDENVASGTPEVLYDVVLGPFVSYANLVYRIDVLDQLQVCTPENFFFPLSSAVEPGHYSALSRDDQDTGHLRNLLSFSVDTAHTCPVFAFQSCFHGGESSKCWSYSLQNGCSGIICECQHAGST